VKEIKQLQQQCINPLQLQNGIRAKFFIAQGYRATRNNRADQGSNNLDKIRPTGCRTPQKNHVDV
jgi:hypothetical protein